MRVSQLLPIVSLLASWPLISAVPDLPEFLAKVDQAAPRFSGIAADLTRVMYTKVIDDKTEELGKIQLKKAKAKDLQVLIAFEKPDAKTVAFRGKKAQIYYPKLKTVQEYDLGKQGDLIDQFLLVGFGTTGKALTDNYEMKVAGEETIAGQKTLHLEMVPKTADRRERLTKLDLWMAESGAYPVQQKFTQPSGDFTTVTYTNVQLNPSLPQDGLDLKLPSDVKREFPQK